MIKKVFSASALALVLCGSAASATQLHCKVAAGPSQGNWISEEFYFDFDVASNSATVIDGIVNYYYKKPIKAKLTHKDGIKDVFSWNIKTSSTTGNQVNMLYRAAYFHADKSFTVLATPQGYANNFNARGTCE